MIQKEWSKWNVVQWMEDSRYSFSCLLLLAIQLKNADLVDTFCKDGGISKVVAILNGITEDKMTSSFELLAGNAALVISHTCIDGMPFKLIIF